MPLCQGRNEVGVVSEKFNLHPALQQFVRSEDASRRTQDTSCRDERYLHLLAMCGPERSATSAFREHSSMTVIDIRRHVLSPFFECVRVIGRIFGQA